MYCRVRTHAPCKDNLSKTLREYAPYRGKFDIIIYEKYYRDHKNNY